MRNGFSVLCSANKLWRKQTKFSAKDLAEIRRWREEGQTMKRIAVQGQRVVHKPHTQGGALGEGRLRVTPRDSCL